MPRPGRTGTRRRAVSCPRCRLPRRMWAGVKMRFDRPLRVGETARRVSTVADVAPKSGRSGDALLRHRAARDLRRGRACHPRRAHRPSIARSRSGRRGLAGAPKRPRSRPGSRPIWSREIEPTTVLLFRYSALTMNSHRIHYDRDYVTGVEGYPGPAGARQSDHHPAARPVPPRAARGEAQDPTRCARSRRCSTARRSPSTGAPGPGEGEGRLWALTRGRRNRPDGGDHFRGLSSRIALSIPDLGAVRRAPASSPSPSDRRLPAARPGRRSGASRSAR